jgi:hypothetical protein
MNSMLAPLRGVECSMFDVEKQSKSFSVNEIAIHIAMLALTPMGAGGG